MYQKIGLLAFGMALLFSTFAINPEPASASAALPVDLATVDQQTATPRSGIKFTITGNGAPNGVMLFQNAIPSAWRSTNAARARYDIKLNGSAVQVQTCRYQQGHSIIRRRINIIASIVDLNTNRTIASRTFSGGNPAACLQREIFRQGVSTNLKDGTPPSANTFKAWVQTTLKLK